MTVKVTGKFLDNKRYSCSANKCSELSSEWNKKFKNNNNVPPIIGIIYSGPLALFYTNWKQGKNIRQPGSGGFFDNGSKRSFKISVTSNEFPYSVINNDYIVVLSKEKGYKPIVTDTNGFYLAKITCKNPDGNKNLDLDYYMYVKTYDGASKPNVIFDFIKVSNIYNNSLLTIAYLCNSLANIDQRFSFSIQSADKFTFYWDSKASGYIPLLYTKDDKYINVFTPEYFSDDIYYYTEGLQWWHNVFAQTIELKQPTTKSVTINNSTYFNDNTKSIKDIILTPTTSPANISEKEYLPTKIYTSSKSTNNIFWIILIIICIIVIIIFIFVKFNNKRQNNNNKNIIIKQQLNNILNDIQNNKKIIR